MRILNKDAGDKALSDLGFEDKDLKKLLKAITSPQGMILVTGPTGSGKTTTLYSVLKHINKPDMNILTAEDPVEYELDGVGQVQIKDAAGRTLSEFSKEAKGVSGASSEQAQHNAVENLAENLGKELAVSLLQKID